MKLVRYETNIFPAGVVGRTFAQTMINKLEKDGVSYSRQDDVDEIIIKTKYTFHISDDSIMNDEDEWGYITVKGDETGA